MDDTKWDDYGTGNYEKCADCMVHSGYESTAVMDAVRRPWHIAKVALFGPETEKPMAPEISLANQRPAQYVFSKQVEEQMAEIAARKPAKAPRVKVIRTEAKTDAPAPAKTDAAPVEATAAD
jgi:hypothetical protein